MKFHYPQIFILIFSILFGLTTQESNATQEEIPNDKVYELIDSTFDHYINQKEYKWLILLYVKTCSHCARARKEINNIYNKVLDSSVRFGQIEIQSNIIISVRFNTTQVPYIVLFQEGKMFEFTKYPNEKNLNDFLNSDKVEEDSLPIPPTPKFTYIAWVMLRDGVKSLGMSIERYLHKKGYKVKVKTYYLVIAALVVLSLFCLLQYWCILKCCSFDDFEEYVKQQEELAMKNKGNGEGKEKNDEEGEGEDNQQPQQQELKDIIDPNEEEKRKKEAEEKKENQSKKKQGKKGKGKQTSSQEKDVNIKSNKKNKEY